MDVKATKLQFIERYLKISDETIIKKLYQTLNEEVSKKKRLPLTEQENEAINKGMEDIKNGHTLSGEQVRAKNKNEISRLDTMRKEIWTETASNEYDQNIEYLF